MVECKPISTAIAHGVVLCRENGAEKEDETTYISIVGSLMFVTHTKCIFNFSYFKVYV